MDENYPSLSPAANRRQKNENEYTQPDYSNHDEADYIEISADNKSKTIATQTSFHGQRNDPTYHHEYSEVDYIPGYETGNHSPHQYLYLDDASISSFNVEENVYANIETISLAESVKSSHRQTTFLETKGIFNR